MKVTYISHSGFLAEFSDCTCLFDYYEGQIPAVRPDKPLYVFVSHGHSDHFNPEIFKKFQEQETCYILSHDIKRHAKKYEHFKNLYFVKPEETITLPSQNNTASLSIQTLRSTDCGAAFLINHKGKYIYHAGDLNWWVWEGETKQYNNNMTANFMKYTEPLKGKELFAAFLPLDPRPGQWYDKGFLHIMKTAHVKHAFPMHFWKDFSVIPKFTTSSEGSHYKENIMNITEEGQTFVCTE